MVQDDTTIVTRLEHRKPVTRGRAFYARSIPGEREFGLNALIFRSGTLVFPPHFLPPSKTWRQMTSVLDRIPAHWTDNGEISLSEPFSDERDTV